MKFALAALLVMGLALVALEVDGQNSPASPPLVRPQPAASPANAQTPQQPAATPQATMPASQAQSQTPPSSTAGSHKPRKRAKKAEVAETPPPPPPPPPTLEQTPPTAPNVTLRNGELTIDAPNSTLSQVLHAVQALTGASVDIPGSASNDRVVAHLGPGQPRDVLNTLLNGSKFNYVILGVNGDPGGVQKIILTTRPAGGVTTAQNNQPAPQPVEEPDEPIAENPYPEPAQVPGGMHRPGFPGRPVQPLNPGNSDNSSSDDSQNSFAGPGGEAQQNGAKTPEQLMQELQQMQQQQQQYEQQLNPANRPPQQ